MRPITWQTIGQPNFGNANSMFQQSAAMLGGGMDAMAHSMGYRTPEQELANQFTQGQVNTQEDNLLTNALNRQKVQQEIELVPQLADAEELKNSINSMREQRKLLEEQGNQGTKAIELQTAELKLKGLLSAEDTAARGKQLQTIAAPMLQASLQGKPYEFTKQDGSTGSIMFDDPAEIKAFMSNSANFEGDTAFTHSDLETLNSSIDSTFKNSSYTSSAITRTADNYFQEATSVIEGQNQDAKQVLHMSLIDAGVDKDMLDIFSDTTPVSAEAIAAGDLITDSAEGDSQIRGDLLAIMQQQNLPRTQKLFDYILNDMKAQSWWSDSISAKEARRGMEGVMTRLQDGAFQKGLDLTRQQSVYESNAKLRLAGLKEEMGLYGTRALRSGTSAGDIKVQMDNLAREASSDVYAMYGVTPDTMLLRKARKLRADRDAEVDKAKRTIGSNDFMAGDY